MNRMGFHERGRVPSLDTSLHYLVTIDGHPVAQHVNDPLAAAYHAAKAKDQDAERNVCIVVLTAEEAAFTAEQIQARPFYPSPAEQAEQAFDGIEKQRQPHVLAGSATASDRKERT